MQWASSIAIREMPSRLWICWRRVMNSASCNRSGVTYSNLNAQSGLERDCKTFRYSLAVWELERRAHGIFRSFNSRTTRLSQNLHYWEKSIITLILHQCNQRRNYNTQFIINKRWNLVTERLSSYKSHQLSSKSVPPVGIRTTTSLPCKTI